MAEKNAVSLVIMICYDVVNAIELVLCEGIFQIKERKKWDLSKHLIANDNGPLGRYIRAIN